jgi:hypothetical protein
MSEACESGDVENVEPVAKGTRKRAKLKNNDDKRDTNDVALTTTRPKKRVKKAGMLARVMDIPLEVLFEVNRIFKADLICAFIVILDLWAPRTSRCPASRTLF